MENKNRENVEQILNPLWRDGYHAAAKLIEHLLADNKKLMDQLSLYAGQKQNRSEQIYQFAEHNLTVSGEENDLIRLAELLRYEEGTLGDLRFQIEMEFDIDGVATDSEEKPLQEKYPKGSKIVPDHMANEPYPVPDGTIGTVECTCPDEKFFEVCPAIGSDSACFPWCSLLKDAHRSADNKAEKENTLL